MTKNLQLDFGDGQRCGDQLIDVIITTWFLKLVHTTLGERIDKEKYCILTLRNRLSNSLIWACPLAMAVRSGVMPSLFLASVRLPAKQRQRTISVWPFLAAKCNGYWPSVFVRSTEHPKAHKDWATVNNPSLVAKCRAVSPLWKKPKVPRLE